MEKSSEPQVCARKRSRTGDRQRDDNSLFVLGVRKIMVHQKGGVPTLSRRKGLMVETKGRKKQFLKNSYIRD